jgi:hypothetical protein
MAETRFGSDPCRISKKLQNMTHQGRYMLNTPGNGETPSYMADPHIIMQKWGGNLRTNVMDIDNELRGVNRRINKDCLGKDEYNRFSTTSQAIEYPISSTLTTEQSRAILPAWTTRDLEQSNWQYLYYNPQQHTSIPFKHNINSRSLDKERFVSQIPVNLSNQYTPLPTNFGQGGYVGGPVLGTQTMSCAPIKKSQ